MGCSYVNIPPGFPFEEFLGALKVSPKDTSLAILDQCIGHYRRQILVMQDQLCVKNLQIAYLTAQVLIDREISTAEREKVIREMFSKSLSYAVSQRIQYLAES